LNSPSGDVQCELHSPLITTLIDGSHKQCGAIALTYVRSKAALVADVDCIYKVRGKVRKKSKDE
jgi:hypothetical protein